MYKKKSAIEKLHESHGLPKVEKITAKMSKRWLAGRSLGESRGEGTVVIPAPIEVDEIMKKVPKGKIITINQIREILAKKHQATIGCPITCGIFAWIAAYAAEEARLAEDSRKLGESRRETITPWWRTLKSEGMLNEKYPGGAENQKDLLEQEGHQIIKKGKNYFVADFEKLLV